jgi:hypothetical protein
VNRVRLSLQNMRGAVRWRDELLCTERWRLGPLYTKSHEVRASLATGNIAHKGRARRRRIRVRTQLGPNTRCGETVCHFAPTTSQLENVAAFILVITNIMAGGNM